MKPLLSLNRVVVFAPDIVRARNFYQEILGLDLLHAGNAMLTFQGTDFLLTVFQCEELPAPDLYSRRPGVSVVFKVQSIEAAMSHLSAQGVSILHDSPNSSPIGRYVAFTDPFGTVFELLECV